MDIHRKIDLFYCFAKKLPSAGMMFFCPETEEVLLCKRSEEMSSPNLWSLPGGRSSDKDNNTLDVARRETEEELSALPNNKKILGTHQLETKKHDYVVYIYSISKNEKDQFTKEIELDEENDSFKWFNINNLPSYDKCHLDFTWVPQKLKSLTT